MANVSPNADAAAILRGIAADEDRHYRLIKYQIEVSQMSAPERKAHEEQMEYLLGHRHPSQVSLTPTDRPFPQTYGDWVNLAEDIKAKYQDDPVMIAAANTQLREIAQETGSAEEAKRWLVGKANELGIK